MACYMKAGFMQSWHGIVTLVFVFVLGIHGDSRPARKASGGRAFLEPELGH